MNNLKKRILSLILVFSFIGLNVNNVFAEELPRMSDENTTYVSIGDTELTIIETDTEVKVQSYIDDIWNHTSIVNKIDGTIQEITQNSNNTKQVEEIFYDLNTTNLQNSNLQSGNIAPLSNDMGNGGGSTGYSLLSSYKGHIADPSLTGYLYGKNYTESGAAKTISFTKGTVIGTVTALLISFIPGVNVSAVIASLGGSVIGGVLGAAIDGNIWAVDYYTDLYVTVKAVKYLQTYRFTRYSKVINKKTGNTQEIYVERYGNWDTNSGLIHSGLTNYFAR